MTSGPPSYSSLSEPGELLTSTTPRPPGRRFSLLLTVLLSIMVFVYIVGIPPSPPLIDGGTPPPEQPGRPADALERLVSREMDLRAVMRGDSWEWWAYQTLAGGNDPIEEAQAWYDELVDTVESP